MNTIQEDTLNMFYSLSTTVDKYQPTWVANTVFTATYNLFKPKIALIEQNRDAQIINNTGITTDKNTKRAVMVDKALFIINRIQSYATVAANSDLLESTHYTPSDMSKARDTDIVGICDTIVAKATANLANLANYGITQVLITDLQTAITNYAATLAKPRTAKAQTKNATENLTQLFRDTTSLLTQRLDLDIEVFKTTKPDFYSQYWTSRVIIPTSVGTTAVKAEVTSKATGEPVKGVTFSFEPVTNGLAKAMASSNNSPIVKKSAEKGQFRITNMPEGTYQVTVSKLGYKTQVLNVNVINGETTDLLVELE